MKKKNSGFSYALSRKEIEVLAIHGLDVALPWDRAARKVPQQRVQIVGGTIFLLN